MSAPHTLDDLTRLIQSRYPDLSPQFQAGARYLNDHPTQVSTLSARKLAALAGVDVVDPNLTNQLLSEPEAERYSFIFDGSAQALDHALDGRSGGLFR